jgi:hypothetical protein
VTRMNIDPRELSACSFAASEAEVEEAGYSPGALSATEILKFSV